LIFYLNTHISRIFDEFYLHSKISRKCLSHRSNPAILLSIRNNLPKGKFYLRRKMLFEFQVLKESLIPKIFLFPQNYLSYLFELFR
jgi:hypothetical protein